MTKEERKIINDEIAKTYELYGFEMSFNEFKDVFELGAMFGHALAQIQKSQNLANPVNTSPENIVWEYKPVTKKPKTWLSKILK